MIHFRGLPTVDNSEWQPICSTKGKPVAGATTKFPAVVDCPDCRAVLHMPRLKPAPAGESYPVETKPGEPDDFDKRYP